jgi:hypothetical protein
MKWLIGLAAVLSVLAVAAPVHATVFTLTDMNSVFRIDSALGADQWLVEGTSQLFEQGFWFRLGDTGPEYRLGNFYSNGWVDQGGRTATIQYTNSQFTAEVVYTLTGGSAGSGTSDVAETIRLVNTSRTTLPMRFFQYCDFDLNGTPGDDVLRFPNANAVRQTDGAGVGVSETVVTPSASHHEGGFYPITRGKLDDNMPTTLNDLPAYGGGSITGDVTWAYEWDRSIAQNGSFIISKDKHLEVVPEPGTLLLLGLGLVGAEITRRRKKA